MVVVLWQAKANSMVLSVGGEKMTLWFVKMLKNRPKTAGEGDFEKGNSQLL